MENLLFLGVPILKHIRVIREGQKGRELYIFLSFQLHLLYFVYKMLHVKKIVNKFFFFLTKMEKNDKNCQKTKECALWELAFKIGNSVQHHWTMKYRSH